MNYLYATEHKNSEIFSSWRVLYHTRNATAFPVRLIEEIWGRTKYLLHQLWNMWPYDIYDPCGWIGYMMTVLWLLDGSSIETIVVSDINKEFLDYAQKNLSLLSIEGVNKRMKELQDYVSLYNKESHTWALEDAYKILNIVEHQNQIRTFTYQNDIMNSWDLGGHMFDTIIVDFPYWQLVSRNRNVDYWLIFQLFKKVLKENGILVIISDKQQKYVTDLFLPQWSFVIGKRKIRFYSKL